MGTEALIDYYSQLMLLDLLTLFAKNEQDNLNNADRAFQRNPYLF